MTHLIARFAKDESGATAIEYALIAGLVSVVLIGASTNLGSAIKAKLNAITTALGGTASTT